MKTALGLLLLAAVGWARQITPQPNIGYRGKPGDVNANIINGQTATPGQFPYQAAIQTTTGAHVCGGALIADTWIMTAAHCVPQAPTAYRIVLGMHDQSNFDNGGQPEVLLVRGVFRHAQYVQDPNQGFPNDIALVQMWSGANLNNPFIEIIPLARDGDDFTGDECIVGGWGYIHSSGTPAATVLQYLSTTVLSNPECQNYMGQWPVLNNQVCVYTGVSGPCWGDSGGPLVCTRGGVDYLVGELSWMMGQCLVEYPVVYVRMVDYRAWIISIIGALP